MSLGTTSGNRKVPMDQTWNTFQGFMDTTNGQLHIECTFVDKDGKHRFKSGKEDKIRLVVDFGSANAIPGLAGLASQASEAIEKQIHAQRAMRAYREREAAKPTTMQPLKGGAKATPALVPDKPTKGRKRKSPTKG